jgi:hypothetical protein
MTKITKKMQKEVIADIRRQLVWINNAIESNDFETLDQLALQLSATALNLTTEELTARANAKVGA